MKDSLMKLIVGILLGLGSGPAWADDLDGTPNLGGGRASGGEEGRAAVLIGGFGSLGSGSSSGGIYRLSSNPALPFPGPATVPGEVPTLEIRWGDGFVQINWEPVLPGFVLERTDQLSPAHWETVVEAKGSPLKLDATRGAAFFRLRRL